MPIFKCKTSEAYYIKILSELLTNNIKTGYFAIDNNGINLRIMDHPQLTLIDLTLSSENFTSYKFQSNDKDKLCIGLNLNHFHKILKSIKKKDSLQMYINTEASDELQIKTIPKENTRTTTSYIKILNIQVLDIEVPTGYGRPVIVNSSEFQKMCKDICSIGSNNIKVVSRNFYIEFIADVDSIIKRSVSFGEGDDDDDDNSDEKKEGESIESTFSTDQLQRIMKISGLNTKLYIYTGIDLPILFRSNVGNLGTISVYLKSKEMIRKETAGYE
jgi:proliferating cell nuclear antigen PCNA